MDYDQTLDAGIDDSQIGISPVIKGYLKTTSGWAKFLGIVGFVLSGLMLLGTIFAASIISAMTAGFEQELGTAVPISAGFVSIFYFFIAALYFIPSLFLFQFGNKTAKSLNNLSQDELESGLANLKNYFTFWGILTIVIIAFYALIILFAGVGAAMAF